MKVKLKNIGSFFIVLSGMIILAHAVIPHNHHFDANSIQQIADCESHEARGDAGAEYPVEPCHAFNILINQNNEINVEALDSRIIIDSPFPVPESRVDFLFQTDILSPAGKIFISLFFCPSYHSVRGPPLA